MNIYHHAKEICAVERSWHSLVHPFWALRESSLLVHVYDDPFEQWKISKSTHEILKVQLTIDPRCTRFIKLLFLLGELFVSPPPFAPHGRLFVMLDISLVVENLDTRALPPKIVCSSSSSLPIFSSSTVIGSGEDECGISGSNISGTQSVLWVRAWQRTRRKRCLL